MNKGTLKKCTLRMYVLRGKIQKCWAVMVIDLWVAFKLKSVKNYGNLWNDSYLAVFKKVKTSVKGETTASKSNMNRLLCISQKIAVALRKVFFVWLIWNFGSKFLKYKGNCVLIAILIEGNGEHPNVYIWNTPFGSSKMR